MWPAPSHAAERLRLAAGRDALTAGTATVRLKNGARVQEPDTRAGHDELRARAKGAAEDAALRHPRARADGRAYVRENLLPAL